MNKPIITQQELKSKFLYIPETGKFYNLLLNCKPLIAIKHDGSGKNYYRVKIAQKDYLQHRLAFLYMTGSFPKNNVDHINGNGLDNRWCNLRDATYGENSRNQKLSTKNTSGLFGVGWHKGKNRWVARISFERKNMHIGCYTDFFEACCARKSAEYKLGYHANHGSIRG